MLTPAVLAYVTAALQNPEVTFDGHSVGNALYGLQQMSDSPETRVRPPRATQHCGVPLAVPPRAVAQVRALFEADA